MTTTKSMEKGVLVDLTRCIGCRGCQVACKSWNERGVKPTIAYGNFTNPPKLNSECYTNIAYREEEREQGPVWNFIKNQCMHCKDPACASVCPWCSRSTGRSPWTRRRARNGGFGAGREPVHLRAGPNASSVMYSTVR